MLQVLINMFRLIKIKAKSFGIFYHNNIFFHCYNDLIELLETFLVILLCRWKRHSIRLILFFDLYELFPAFICANNIGSLVKNLSEVKSLNPFPFLLLLHDVLVVTYLEHIQIHHNHHNQPDLHLRFNYTTYHNPALQFLIK